MIASVELVAAFKASLANPAHAWTVVAVQDDAAGIGGPAFTTGTVCLFSRPLNAQATAVIGVTHQLSIGGSPFVFSDIALVSSLIVRAAAFQTAQQASTIAKLSGAA